MKSEHNKEAKIYKNSHGKSFYIVRDGVISFLVNIYEDSLRN